MNYIFFYYNNKVANKKSINDNLNKVKPLKDVAYVDMYTLPLLLVFHTKKTNLPIYKSYEYIRTLSQPELLKLYDEMVAFMAGNDIEAINQEESSDIISPKEFYGKQYDLKDLYEKYFKKMGNDSKSNQIPTGSPIIASNEEISKNF